MFILKDQFSDFEELKMLTPAREQAYQLFKVLCNIKVAEPQLNQLVQCLPVILKVVEYDSWVGRYNFFLLIKGLLPHYERQIFTMFSKVLIESLLRVEDEVRIIVTEVIE